MKSEIIQNKFQKQVEKNIYLMEQDYWQEKLRSLQEFIVKNRQNNQLKLSAKKLVELSELVDQLLGIRIDFTKTNLSVLERLNLV